MRAVQDGHVKAHNVLRGKRDAALRRQWPGGPPPLGMRLKSVLVERNGRQEVAHCILEHDPESGWIVQKMFAMARETGWGSNRLAQALNADPEIPDKFKPFNHSGVAYVLRNPIYIGELLWEENATDIIDDTRVIKRNAEEDMVRVPGFCEPLVSREAWDAVAELRRLRSEAYWRSRRDEDSGKQIEPTTPGLVLKYLLTGLVRCGECGRSMRPTSSGRRSKAGKSYTYYACPGGIAGGCHNKTTVPEAWLREAVIARLRARLFPAPGTS
jgi:site-specific DNA recombinase